MNGQMGNGLEMNQNGLRHVTMGKPRPPRFDHPPFQPTDVSYFSELPPCYHDINSQNFNLAMGYQNNPNGLMSNVASGSSAQPMTSSALVMASTTQAIADMNSRAVHGRITAQGQIIVEAPRVQEATFVPVQTEPHGSRDLSPYPFDNGKVYFYL